MERSAIRVFVSVRVNPAFRFASCGLQAGLDGLVFEWGFCIRISPPHCRPNQHIPRRPVPTARGVSRASRGAGRAAVAFAGRLTPVPHWRPKSHGSGAPIRAPLGFHWRRRRTWSDRRQAPFGAHQRWISTVSPPGGMRSKPTNTARGMPGEPANPAATIACVLTHSHTGLRGFSARRSARPRIFAKKKAQLGRFSRRENESG